MELCPKVGNPYGTFEGFLDEWDSKIESTIRGFNLREDLEDTKQALYLDLFQKGYLDRFDSSKGTIATWVYGFVRNFLRRRFHQNKRDFIYNGVPILPEYDDAYVGEALFLEVFCPDADSMTEVEDNVFIEQALDILSYPQYQAYSNAPDGTPRDMKHVAILLLQGLEPKDIANKFNTSVQFIYKLMKRMATITELSVLN